MTEQIVSITDGTFSLGEKYIKYDGLTVVTDKQTIYIGIDNGQNCCENWGYITSEDDVQDFVGATLLGISVVDDACKVYDVLQNDYKEAAAMFVNLDTSKGLLQLVLYNEHNGYYSHAVVIRSEQLTEDSHL